MHPGEILSDELAELGVSARVLARQMCVPRGRLAQVMAGEYGVSDDMARRLGLWFGMSAAVWMNLQAAYAAGMAQRPGSGGG